MNQQMAHTELARAFAIKILEKFRSLLLALQLQPPKHLFTCAHNLFRISYFFFIRVVSLPDSLLFLYVLTILSMYAWNGEINT